MKSIRIWAVAALAAGGLALGASAQAASHGGGGGGGHGGWSGGHGGWSGGHGGWSGASSGGHGGYWHGGYGHGYYGHGYYPYHSTAIGFYFGAPWVWGPWYWWGYPYDYYYPGYGAPGYGAYPSYPADGGVYPDGTMQPMPPTTEVDPNAAGAPTQAPAYMNYCVSSKAYYPKVATCPEGWKFVPTH